MNLCAINDLYDQAKAFQGRESIPPSLGREYVNILGHITQSVSAGCEDTLCGQTQMYTYSEPPGSACDTVRQTALLRALMACRQATPYLQREFTAVLTLTTPLHALLSAMLDSAAQALRPVR
ncbi:hypothetical protein KIPB_006990 [Kipferlia bialata]|uniref:Uncharacterized protein n=1 Tax=Kipferlia bialata TaxID=797122 RepID=A0A9K3CZN2_9EUKA|nr:hypothetical protein KIPB_006990 [Kipferlia bialata]|eukprot:g6990.t1